MSLSFFEGFTNKNDAAKYAIMDIIDHSGASGSWNLKAGLAEQGFDYSTATVGRLLKELDADGYTEIQGKKGRIMTSAGKEFYLKTRDRLASENTKRDIFRSVRIRSFDELIDLVTTRRMLETEAVSYAIQRGTPEQLEAIKATLKAHSNAVSAKEDPTQTAMDFHSAIAIAANNKALYATISLLIMEEEKLETKFVKLTTREKGSEYIIDHENIYNAICARNQQDAASLMYNHLSRILDTIRLQAAGPDNPFDT